MYIKIVLFFNRSEIMPYALYKVCMYGLVAVSLQERKSTPAPHLVQSGRLCMVQCETHISYFILQYVRYINARKDHFI